MSKNQVFGRSEGGKFLIKRKFGLFPTFDAKATQTVHTTTATAITKTTQNTAVGSTNAAENRCLFGSGVCEQTGRHGDYAVKSEALFQKTY